MPLSHGGRSGALVMGSRLLLDVQASCYRNVKGQQHIQLLARLCGLNLLLVGLDLAGEQSGQLIATARFDCKVLVHGLPRFLYCLRSVLVLAVSVGHGRASAEPVGLASSTQCPNPQHCPALRTVQLLDLSASLAFFRPCDLQLVHCTGQVVFSGVGQITEHPRISEPAPVMTTAAVRSALLTQGFSTRMKGQS